MIKLIAIDMDGTLLNANKQLLEETKQYFKEFDVSNKKMKIFDKDQDYSDFHCQNGAAFDTNDVIFDWLLEG